jgi:hypothetical protein
MSAAAPWAELADLAERELSLARDGRWPEVAECSGERVRRAAALPVPPPEARSELERLAAFQDALTAVLTSARALTVRELGALRAGGRAARGYASAAAHSGAPGRLDGRG